MSDDTTQPGAEVTPTAAPAPVAPATPATGEDAKTFDESYVRKLREEAATYRVKLKEFEDRDKSEVEKLQERATRAEQDLESSRREQARLWVAAKHGISAEHLDLLSGDSEEALEVQAQKIASLVAFKNEPSRVLVGEKGEPAPLALNGDGIEDALKRALGIQ